MSLMSLHLPLPDGGPAESTSGDRADAATTSSVIAELRRLLAAPGMLTHPAIRHELHKLDEQLAAGLSAGGRLPGRHRSVRGVEPGSAGLCPGKESPQPALDHERNDQPDDGEHDAQDRAVAGGDRAPQAPRPR
jgi:hypothetical protein